MAEVPRKLSLVRFDAEALPQSIRHKYPFRAGRTYIFFGEISNMPGHCVVADHRSGRVYSGYQTEHFTELTEKET